MTPSHVDKNDQEADGKIKAKGKKLVLENPTVTLIKRSK
jgi:hypothetical protein